MNQDCYDFAQKKLAELEKEKTTLSKIDYMLKLFNLRVLIAKHCTKEVAKVVLEKFNMN